MFSMFVSEEEGLKIYKQDTSLPLSLAFGENTATKTMYSILDTDIESKQHCS